MVNTFKMLAELPTDSLGAYVISMARSASDVLAVVLLQRECGVKVHFNCHAFRRCKGSCWAGDHASTPYWSCTQDYLRVAPLFETLDDLAGSTDTMQQLLSNEWYRNHINGEQEVMIGYSDSGKDAGRMAAAWGLYEVQESLVRVAAVRIFLVRNCSRCVYGCYAAWISTAHGIVHLRRNTA